MKREYKGYELAQLCEVAYIFGQVDRNPNLQRKKEFDGLDIEEMLEDYELIFECWSRGIDVRTGEENGYIGTYAERFITDYFYDDITTITEDAEFY